MKRDSVMDFLATGSVVLPFVLYLGTGSLDVVAIAMVIMMLSQMLLLIVRADDPIGDKMRDEGKEGEKPPQ